MVISVRQLGSRALLDEAISLDRWRLGSRSWWWLVGRRAVLAAVDDCCVVSKVCRERRNIGYGWLLSILPPIGAQIGVDVGAASRS